MFNTNTKCHNRWQKQSQKQNQNQNQKQRKDKKQRPEKWSIRFFNEIIKS